MSRLRLRWVAARGVLATEALLLAEIERLLPPPPFDLELLRQPIRIVVPSRSMREHVAARLVRERGRPVAGVEIQTLFAVASGVCAAAAERPPRGGMLFEVLVRRAARREPQLVAEMGHLRDGYGAAVGAVRDLVDAGLDGVGARPVLATLARRERGAADRRNRRARAVVRVAAAVLREMKRLGIGTRAQVFERAATLLADSGGALLPARAIRIHGFADATGVASRLVAELLELPDSSLIVDLPDDPADPDRAAPGNDFALRFLRRLTRDDDDDDDPMPLRPSSTKRGPLPALRAARGVDDEMAALARAIRSCLDAGVQAESIAVVGRDLAPYRGALRIHLTRHAVPFSGVAERGVGGLLVRRGQAVLALVELAERAPMERWLDALSPVAHAESTTTSGSASAAQSAADLRLALNMLGAVRVVDVAGLELRDWLDRDQQLPLPVRQGLWAPDADDDGERTPARAIRRRVSGSRIERAVDAARALVRRFATWPESAPVAVHLEHAAALLHDALGLDGDDGAALLAMVDRLGTELPGGITVTRDEIALVLRRAISDALASPIGGLGGGVQVLTVTEARGRSFSHLFVIGLNRDVFPRIVSEDPLLPDRLRDDLVGVLPALTTKRLSGYDEEGYLFAQLCTAASKSITLSWQATDDDGRERAASPFIERLVLSASGTVTEVAAETRSATVADDVVGAVVRGGREALGDLLPLALESVASELGIESTAIESTARTVARARLAVLAELEPARGDRDGRRVRELGPYFGFVGAARLDADPRRGDMYVTSVEQLAGCGWQFFLQKLLRLEPTPDPFGLLPTVDPLILGSIVHDALEAIVTGARGDGPSRGRRLDPTVPGVDVSWPSDEQLARVVAKASGRGLRAAGVGRASMASLYAQLARGYLEAARAVDWPWPFSTVAVVGAEVEGELALPRPDGAARVVRFRADRVDRHGARLRLTDYKTGRPLADRPTVEALRAALLRQVAVGQKLQPVVYALGAGSGDAEGRFVFLRPDVPEHARTTAANASDEELRAAFERVATTVFDACDQGALLPRLIDADGEREPRRCSYCAVAEACVRGDSGSRRRLAEWLTRHAAATESAEDGESLAPSELAMLQLWKLAGVAPESERASDG